MTLIADKEQITLANEFFQLVSDELLDLATIGKIGGARLDGINYKLTNLKDALSKIAIEEKVKIVEPPVVEPKIEEPSIAEPVPVVKQTSKQKKKF
ncbi:hypothetical protein KKH23_09065 [Patescibacteria group bacterium]|nr:hypothetical protein [Patescibacteria group bacterium]